MGDRNVDIWSTRLQREILALESHDDKKIELLPPFIAAVGHTLNIEGGIAKIEFRIDVEVAAGAPQEAVASSGAAAAQEQEDAEEDVTAEAATEDPEGDEGREQSANEEDGHKVDDPAAAAGGGDAVAQEFGSTDSESADPATTTTGEAPLEKDKTEHCVVLVLDASLYWKPDSSEPAPSSNPRCYPFQKPLAVVKSGCHLLSAASTLVDGDEVDIDFDWTPSIHLSDAVTHVALKIRECVRRGEPLHPARSEDRDEDPGLSDALLREAREAKESLLETKKAVGALFTSGISTLSARGSSFAAKGQTARSSVSKGFLSLGESLSQLAEAGTSAVQGEGEVAAGAEAEAPQNVAPKVVKEVPDVGDEIDLSDEPWNQCVGMYSCKAIQRPEFVTAALAQCAANQKKENEVSTASSMFNRFAQSAKSVMEESFLMITENCLIEFKSNKLSIGSGTVSFAIKIEKMAKLKFRREESLSLFFKQASNDPLVYMCLDSALAVQDIQNVLKRHGVKGKHTNASTQRAVQMALNLVALIQRKEKELIDAPTVERVNEIMDVYRRAAEQFEAAGDPRHAEVLAHMQRFLAQKFTASILEGTFGQKAAAAAPTAAEDATPVPQGKILEQSRCTLLNDDDDDDDDDDSSFNAADDAAPEDEETEAPPQKKTEEHSDPTLQNMENILKEAVQDMSDLGMDAEDITSLLASPPEKSPSTETDDLAQHDDMFAELDAMLNDADEELNELLKS